MTSPRPIRPGISTEAVIDTDVFSFLLRGDSRGAQYARRLAGFRLSISFQTVAEVYRLGAANDWGLIRTLELENSFRRLVVFPSTNDLAREWAAVTDETSRLGRKLAAGDAWIAATARLNGIPLATHNRRHFAVVPVLEVISFAP